MAVIGRGNEKWFGKGRRGGKEMDVESTRFERTRRVCSHLHSRDRSYQKKMAEMKFSTSVLKFGITRRSYRGGRSRRTEPHSICRNLFIPTRASVYGVYKIETIERVEFCVEWVINY